MMGIKNIIYKKNHEYMTLNFDDKIKFTYNDISTIVDNKLVDKYLESFLLLINNWKEKYINTRTIDGDDWELNITFLDGNIKSFIGHGMYPTNFDAFEELNKTIIDEVIR